MIRRAGPRITLVGSLALLVSACGFQMRGDVDFPPQMHSTYIAYSGTDAEVLRTVARTLVLGGVDIARSPAEAGAILELLSADVRRRVLLKDFAGRPREYEIGMSLKYRVISGDGAVLVPVQLVERRSAVVLDPANPLSNAGEIASAVESLREDAVWDMLRRIAATDIPVAVKGNDPDASYDAENFPSEPGRPPGTGQ